MQINRKMRQSVDKLSSEKFSFQCFYDEVFCFLNLNLFSEKSFQVYLKGSVLVLFFTWRKIKDLSLSFPPFPLIWYTKTLSFTLIPLILVWFYFLNTFSFSQYLYIQHWNCTHCSNTVIPSNYVSLLPHEKWPLRHGKVNCGPLSFIMYFLSYCQFGGKIKNWNSPPKS